MINRKLLKIHGIVLIIAGSVMTTNTVLGGFLGKGMMQFLKGNSFALIGFFEAYLLAALLGVFILSASKLGNQPIWHLLAGFVHVILMATNLIFWDFYALGNIEAAGWVSTIMHGVLISVETSTYVILKRKLKKA